MSISKADIFSIYQGCWFFNSLRISKLSCRIFVNGFTLDELRLFEDSEFSQNTTD